MESLQRDQDTVASSRGSARIAVPRLRVFPIPRLRVSRSIAITRGRSLILGELALITLWTLIFARPYLDLDPTIIPNGLEYFGFLQLNHLWSWLRECGACALWNGSMRGGNPAFADPYGSMLHPLVMFTTLGWGVLNGGKLALAGSFLTAGLAQWWLGRVLGLSRAARLWTAGMAVVAGNLAGRMEAGWFSAVISAAACALVLPPLVQVSLTASRRAAVLLGLTLGLVALAGQGYMQIGLVLALPTALILVPWNGERVGLLVRRYAFAALIALLISGIFTIPFFHFLSEFGKDADPTFSGSEPMSYLPFNLVINDIEFFRTQVLHKNIYPANFLNYIGWTPVLFALLDIAVARTSEEYRKVAFLFAFAASAFWVASAEPFSTLARLAPTPDLARIFATIRYPGMIAGLAVWPILVLAGMGIDKLLRIEWPSLSFALAIGKSSISRLSLDLKWLLAIPLLFALFDVQSFTSSFLRTVPLAPSVAPLVSALKTQDLEWVNPPFGETLFIESAVAQGFKLSYGFRAWSWKNRESPEPLLLEVRRAPPPNSVLKTKVSDVGVYEMPGTEYAAVTNQDGGRTVCTATGNQGEIDVKCNVSTPGELTVKENSWSDWFASIDGQSVPLKRSRWLTVDMLPGNHLIQFRYRPWDVPLGLVLTVIGLGLSAFTWWTGDAVQVPDISPTVDHADTMASG